MGTQYRKGTETIGRALGTRIPKAERALLPSQLSDTKQSHEGVQKAIFIESELTREPRKAGTQQGILERQAALPPPLPETLGMNSRGDERQEGPIYTYARVFTWWAFTKRILDAFEAALTNMEEGRTCSNMRNMSRTLHHSLQLQENQLRQDSSATAIADPNSSGRGNNGSLDPAAQPPSDTRSNKLSPSPSPSPGPSATKQSTEYELEDMDSADPRTHWKGKGKANAVASRSNSAFRDTQTRRRKAGGQGAPGSSLGSSPASGSSTALQCSACGSPLPSPAAGSSFAAVVQGSTRGEPAPMPPAGSAWQMSWFCDLPDDREPAKKGDPADDQQPADDEQPADDQQPADGQQPANDQTTAPKPVQPAPVRAYSSFSDLSNGGAYKRMGKALLMALFAQWGTTGAAIIIAYFTPMKGFGCRSGSYLVYGVVATGAFFFLNLSVVLSHQAMRLYQDQHVFKGVTQFHTLAWGHWSVCALANVTRFVGKFLAVSNTIILVLVAVFEFCGLFDNCWCKSCYPQSKGAGFAVLFRSDDDYRRIASEAWIGGILLATFVWIILCCLFYWGRKKLC